MVHRYISKALPNLDPVSSSTYPDRSGMVARKRYCANFITLVSGATMVLFSRPLVPATIHAGRQAISAGLEERHYVYGVLCTAVVVGSGPPSWHSLVSSHSSQTHQADQKPLDLDASFLPFTQNSSSLSLSRCEDTFALLILCSRLLSNTGLGRGCYTI